MEFEIDKVKESMEYLIDYEKTQDFEFISKEGRIYVSKMWLEEQEKIKEMKRLEEIVSRITDEKISELSSKLDEVLKLVTNNEKNK